MTLVALEQDLDRATPLRPLEVTPQTARVRIPVFSDQQNRTLPVNPVITGNPAAGFEIASVTVSVWLPSNAPLLIVTSATAIVASREAIWGILSDPAKFATI